MIDDLLERLPVTSIAALAFILVGGILTLNDTIEWGQYLDDTMKVLIGLGVIGAVRVADKARKDRTSDL